ncbi:MAG: hypothetical protein HY222_07305 [Thaumarchaeota archaeon]|nr:hypothetical protein [Nitrososphaerota archaeon]MBI3642181.1 hypothetical protein [Nitrososphaerota archaeon]
MLRTTITQKQLGVSQRNESISGFSLEQTRFEPSYIIKTMMKIIKTKSKDSMDVETRMQFSKIADAVVRMAEEIRE